MWLHRAIDLAGEGDVLVVRVGRHYEAGYLGEVMTHFCQARKLAGLVIDGCVHDGALLAEMGFPVFARGLSMRGTGKIGTARGFINAPIMIGDVVINAGDLVAGDCDGVVAIPRDQVAQTCDASLAREDKEADIIARIGRGESTVDIYGWR